MKMTGVQIPASDSWKRCGVILPRSKRGFASQVAGDPCIVWDERINNWRMFYFAQPGGVGDAECIGDPASSHGWRVRGPLSFTNPQDMIGGSTHKPYIVTDAYRPNLPARRLGKYWMLGVTCARHKAVQAFFSDSLSGPWTAQRGELIPRGTGEAFDANHTDAVSAIAFADRVLCFYMGYPVVPQQRPGSMLGSAQAIAWWTPGEATAEKQGIILPPHPDPGHWASGWVGGLQVLRGSERRWIAIVNASPTRPVAGAADIDREEPAPSLGGFAFTNAEIPDSGWQFCTEPIEWLADVPADALQSGEGVNLWRQHLLVLPNSRLLLFYNSGSYGREQIYCKVSHYRVQ